MIDYFNYVIYILYFLRLLILKLLLRALNGRKKIAVSLKAREMIMTSSFPPKERKINSIIIKKPTKRYNIIEIKAKVV
jgi:hypothetical protein